MKVLITALLHELASLELPLEKTEEANTSWDRNQMDLPKSKASDAAFLRNCTDLIHLPGQIKSIKPENGLRK